jgi:hypothetical protein
MSVSILIVDDALLPANLDYLDQGGPPTRGPRNLDSTDRRARLCIAVRRVTKCDDSDERASAKTV